MGPFKRPAGQVAILYGDSRSYRAVARIVVSLTLVSLAVGAVTSLPTGGSVLGDVIFVLLSSALVAGWLGVVLWVLATFWRVPNT